jgi:hypothetical protein
VRAYSDMRALLKIPGWILTVGLGAAALIVIGAVALWPSTADAPAPDEPGENAHKNDKKRRARKDAPKRKVFFSFHYQRDIWRVNQIRNAGVVDASAAAGWADASLWEETKKKGDAAIKRLIDEGLKGTTVTAALIGNKTANRKYVTYELERSLEQGNALIGIRIHSLADQDGKTDSEGEVPQALKHAKAPIYNWDREQFGSWVQKAYRRAQKRK